MKPTVWVYDGEPTTPHTLAERGCGEAAEFCTLNRIEPPKYTIGKDAKLLGRYYGSQRRVEVYPGNMQAPVLGGAVIVSRGWPRYRFDYCFGVAAHETGHHLWHLRITPALERTWQAVRNGEPPVTQRETFSAAEAFAESARLYILNAPLLLRARPLRWHFFAEILGLKSMTDLCDWTSLLGASQWVREGERWINGQGTYKAEAV